MVGVVAAGSWDRCRRARLWPPRSTDVGAAGLVRTARHAPGANRRAIGSRSLQRRRGSGRNTVLPTPTWQESRRPYGDADMEDDSP